MKISLMSIAMLLASLVAVVRAELRGTTLEEDSHVARRAMGGAGSGQRAATMNGNMNMMKKKMRNTLGTRRLILRDLTEQGDSHVARRAMGGFHGTVNTGGMVMKPKSKMSKSSKSADRVR